MVVDHRGIKPDPGIADDSIGDGDKRLSAPIFFSDLIVDDVMPGCKAGRIGAALAVDREAQNVLVLRQETGLRGRDHLRKVDRMEIDALSSIPEGGRLDIGS